MELVEELLKDAYELYEKARNEIEKDIRNAAEKAWCATVKATEALLVANGIKYDEIRWPRVRRRELIFLARRNKLIEELNILDRYGSRETYLHGYCFYEGICEPIDTERRILGTKAYIDDVKKIIKNKLYLA